MARSQAIRVLNDAAMGGQANMARDEALLVRVGRRESVPSLRLYQWETPTISLGYFQPYADYEALPPPAGELPLVRRTTGGGAILHDLELTYSLTMPVGHSLTSTGANRLYELVHEAIIACLAILGIKATPCGISDDSGASRGPFFCFQRRHCYDLLIGRDKIAGSAQRRTHDAVLQHGSIVLGNRHPQQPTADVQLPFEQTVKQVRERLATTLAAKTGEVFEEGRWSTDELAAASTLVAKYASEDWTRRF
ncbi:MAG: biotin/lipoate A/B protein ligase family protein [Phycisphaerae bacterium]